MRDYFEKTLDSDSNYKLESCISDIIYEIQLRMAKLDAYILSLEETSNRDEYTDLLRIARIRKKELETIKAFIERKIEGIGI